MSRASAEFTRAEGHLIPGSFPPYFVYILRCADGTFYVGYTSDLNARLEAHAEGRGCKYTAARVPVQLVYSEACDSIAVALTRESQIKRWSGKKKAALAERNPTKLRVLRRRYK